MTGLTYFSNCVAWPTDDVHADGGLCDMIDVAQEVTRRTFLKHIDRFELQNIEQKLGYMKHPKQGLTMAGDFHVAYYRSVLHGETVYFLKHSAIEYVFK